MSECIFLECKKSCLGNTCFTKYKLLLAFSSVICKSALEVCCVGSLSSVKYTPISVTSNLGGLCAILFHLPKDRKMQYSEIYAHNVVGFSEAAVKADLSGQG